METPVTPAPLPLILDGETPDASPCRDGFAGLTPAAQAQRAEIVHRAHSIWECKGRGTDHQLADWLEAEAEVLSAR